VNAKVEPSKAEKKTPIDAKGKPKTQPTRNRDIKYFRFLGVKHIDS
jgi:hypothetical protein